MRRSGRVAWGEVRVGMVVIFAFSVLMWAAFNGSSMTFFKKGHNLTAFFDDVSGLATGSPVWLGGIEVGHVSKIEFVERNGVGKVWINLSIQDDAWQLVSSQSEAAVATMGLMGDKYITLTVRQAGQPPAGEGDILRTRAAADMTAAFSNVPDLMDNLTTTTKHLNKILARIESGEGFLGRITSAGRSSDELDSLVTVSKRLMVGLNDAQVRLTRSVGNVEASFDSVSHGILHGGGTLSKLVWDSTLYVEMTSMTRRINSLAARLDSDQGTLGKLTADSTMYVEIRTLVTDTRALLDDLRANPRKYLKFSVF